MAASNMMAKTPVPMANKYDRVVLLVDMDCFYCQVEERLDPSLKNQPIAVVQYNAWRGGGIIAVNYAARAKGVTRHMRGDEAKEQCPEIQLVKVPNVREKADLTKYREAGKEVAKVLQRFTPLLERASVDEAYLDITDAVNKRLQQMNDGAFVLQPQELVNTYAVGYQTIGEFVTTITTSFITNPVTDDDNFYRNFNENDVPAVRQSNIRLLIGASIASEIRSAVKSETSYECSAGIAHNKILAKLACGINKPNKQTILPLEQMSLLFETLPVGKIKGLGAKFGEEICERLNIRYLGQLLKFTESELQRKFDEKNGTWLYNICRGIDLEAVTPRFYSKSIGCCKKFPGRNNITGLKTLQHWLNELANEINERLEKDICENNRRAKQMVVSFIQEFDGEEVSSSRSAPLQCLDTEMLAKTSLEIIKSNTKQFYRSGSENILNNPIKFLGISAGKFETISNAQNNIQQMFAQQAAKKQKLKNDSKNETQTLSPLKSDSKENNRTKNNLLKQFPIKNNPQISDKSDAELVPEVDNITKGNFLKQIPKDKSAEKNKSFFLNALTKKPLKNSISATENNGTTPILDASEVFSHNQLRLTSRPQNELLKPNEDVCSDSANKIKQKSFFARALQRNEDKIKKITVEDLPLDNINSNIIQNPQRNNVNGVNDLNDITSVQTAEDVCNSELQYENSSLKNNIDLEIIDVFLMNNGSINNKRKYEQISNTEEDHNQNNYRSQYAEFAVPELNLEFLQFAQCSKCGTEIPNDPILLQTHEDYHIAQELSKQQRSEYRKEIRSKIISTKSPPNGINNKKSKIVNNAIKKTSNDITKFLKPCKTSMMPSQMSCIENELLESSTSSIEICDICRLPIKIEQASEHKDFHMAKDLQRQLNQLEVRKVDVVKNPASDSTRKSMKSSMNTSTQQNKVNSKSITQFFTKSNI